MAVQSVRLPIELGYTVLTFRHRTCQMKWQSTGVCYVVSLWVPESVLSHPSVLGAGWRHPAHCSTLWDGTLLQLLFELSKVYWHAPDEGIGTYSIKTPSKALKSLLFCSSGWTAMPTVKLLFVYAASQWQWDRLDLQGRISQVCLELSESLAKIHGEVPTPAIEHSCRAHRMLSWDSVICLFRMLLHFCESILHLSRVP